jgi:15-cis-phytoene synthase
VTRADLVTAAEATIRAGSKSFRAASRLLDRRTRERAWLLYCWCRHCDDVTDGQLLGHGAGHQIGSVAEIHTMTLQVLAGQPVGELPFDALGEVLAECAIPHVYVLDHLAGFALDAEGWRPDDEADLLRYCYNVAGTVGCMMAIVMGIDQRDEETLRRACDLGVAFQLANIARDVRDDHEVGRCYLPAQWMETFAVDPRDPLRPDRRDQLVALVARICELADRYEASAVSGIARLDFRSRWAVHAAAGIYGRIGRRVAHLGPVAWDRRVIVPRNEKAAILLTALGAAVGG